MTILKFWSAHNMYSVLHPFGSYFFNLFTQTFTPRLLFNEAHHFFQRCFAVADVTRVSAL
jgi:hypothetical protein